VSDISNIGYDEQVEGRWGGSDTSNETTPLLGSQTSLPYTIQEANGVAGH
jgi:hypothetical protein